jgi:hypothetical protein
LQNDFLRPRPPGYPCLCGIGEIGILGVVNCVYQPLTSFPVERGALPDLFSREQSDDLRFKFRIVGLKEHAYSFFACEIFGLVGRTCLEDPDEMLEGPLSGGYGFRGSNCIGDVPLKGDSDPPAFFSDREVGVAWHAGLDLDEVRPARLEHIYSFASVLGG